MDMNIPPSNQAQAYQNFQLRMWREGPGDVGGSRSRIRTPALSIASRDLRTPITIPNPMESDLGGLYNLTGTISIFCEPGKAKRAHYGESLVEMRGGQLVKGRDAKSKTTAEKLMAHDGQCGDEWKGGRPLYLNMHLQ